MRKPRLSRAGAPRKPAKTAKYAIGYRKPPVASRWKPGQSGNSKGRPKGARGVGAILNEVIGRRIAVTENGKTRQIPALEVMLRRLANDAMRNDPRALKLLLSLVDRYAQSAEVQTPLEELLAEDQAILAQYLRAPSGAKPAVAGKSRNAN